MSASIASSSVSEVSSAAMASLKVWTLDEIKHASGFSEVSNPFASMFEVVPWRVLDDDTELSAPRFKNSNLPFVIDLTPSEDDWLKVQSGVNYVGNLKPHHRSSETVACKVLLELPSALAEDVANIDKAIKNQAMSPFDVKAVNGSNWMSMMRSESVMMANIVLEGSDALTKLCFIDAYGSAQQGEGVEFFKTQLGDEKLEDFSCKVWVEMQFIEVQSDVHRKSIAVKVHSIALAKTPKEEVASFTQEHVDSFVRAAKRIRVKRL